MIPRTPWTRRPPGAGSEPELKQPECSDVLDANLVNRIPEDRIARRLSAVQAANVIRLLDRKDA
jgi:hypothetical protein